MEELLNIIEPLNNEIKEKIESRNKALKDYFNYNLIGKHLKYYGNLYIEVHNIEFDMEDNLNYFMIFGIFADESIVKNDHYTYHKFTYDSLSKFTQITEDEFYSVYNKINEKRENMITDNPSDICY
jgi:hypothetical protein